MLKREGIQFQVCKNPDVKSSVVASTHRTNRDRLYKYFTYKNTYRYIDVLANFVKAYNDTVHSSMGMAPSRVTDSDILAIWKRMKEEVSHSCRLCEIPRRATRAHQQGKNEVCEARRVEFQQRNVWDREGNRGGLDPSTSWKI